MPRILTEEQKAKKAAYMLEWQRANREKVRATNRQWYADNITEERPKRRERMQGWDKESRNAYMREWREKNHDRLIERERNVVRLRRYGITTEQYQQLYEMSQGKCQICSRSFNENKREPYIDHCHKSKKVRGLLCRFCNMAEGFYGTPELAYRLYEYMKRYEITESL